MFVVCRLSSPSQNGHVHKKMVVDCILVIIIGKTHFLDQTRLPIDLLVTREESRDESIARRHSFTWYGNNDDKSETVGIIGREHT